MSIRTLPQTLSRRLGNRSAESRIRVRGEALVKSAKSKKRLIRYGIFALNVVVLAIATAFVIKTPDTSSTAAQSSLSGTKASAPTSPLDQLSSADIAAHVAQLTRMPEAVAVINHADSANALLAVSATDDKVITKPQVVNTTAKSRRDIVRYVTVAGDSVSSLAAKFSVTSDSIRWSNGLSSDALTAGRELWISPVSDGIVYVVKAGDTPQSLAERYRASKDAIISFNDAEVGGLPVGERIVIPGGTQPASRGGTAGAFSFSWFGSAAIYSANGYDYGWCTWHVANRRREIGNPVPSNLGNANTWYYRAASLGIGVGAAPRAGAVVWHNPGRSLGHVAFVEKINEDGSAYVSDMNYPYWGRVTYRVISAAEFAQYKYIY